MRYLRAAQFAFLSLMGFGGTAFGDVVLNSLNYSENFDGLPTANVTNQFSATIGVQSDVTGATGWQGTKIAGNGTTATPFTADNGAGISGAIYSYGATGTSERALGTIASGSNTMAYGFELRNNTGLTITSVNIAFTQENWRSSTSATSTPNTISAQYSLGEAGLDGTNFLSSATGFTDLDDLDLVGPTPVATNGALDGNLPENQVARSTTLSGLNLAQGQSIFFRWQDLNEQGNDAGLAIDSFSMAFTAVPEPTSLALLGLVGSAGWIVRMRRRKVQN